MEYGGRVGKWVWDGFEGYGEGGNEKKWGRLGRVWVLKDVGEFVLGVLGGLGELNI